MRSSDASNASTWPCAVSCEIEEASVCTLSHVLASRCGSKRIAPSVRLNSTGTMIEHPGGDEQACAARERRRLLMAPGQKPPHRRPHMRVEVGDAGRVGEDVVPVRPDHRREVLHDLEHLERDQQQQRVDVPREPDAHRHDGDDGVEVDPAQVDAQAIAARQPVRVGDVGVERRPDQVDAHAHPGRCRAAVATRRRVTELVEARRGDGESKDEEQQLRLVEGVRSSRLRRPCARARTSTPRGTRRSPAPRRSDGRGT